MKKLTVFYWHSIKSLTGFEHIPHKTVFDYSDDLRNELVDIAMHHGHSIMIKTLKDGNILFALTIHGSFGQR